ncbi:hypothetical protein BsWGS_07849 [Bradybaena similaris]
MMTLALGLMLLAGVPTGGAQAPECSSGATLVPHSSVCQRYTNCSLPPDQPVSRFLGPQQEECPYPQLFDIHQLKCKNFKQAECGSGRLAAKAPCDYVKNLCGSSHCEACGSRWGSCVGLTNGVHAHPGRLWSPFYIVCDTERTIKMPSCPPHSPTGATSIFSPLKNRCVSLWEVPREHGGQQPSCEGKASGPQLYRVADKPDVYYSCPGPKVSYCGLNRQFNETTQKCQRTLRAARLNH